MNETNGIKVSPLMSGACKVSRKRHSVSRYIDGNRVAERRGKMLYRADGQRVTIVEEGVAEIHVYDLPDWISPERFIDTLANTKQQYVRFEGWHDGTRSHFDAYWPFEQLPDNPHGWVGTEPIF